VERAAIEVSALVWDERNEAKLAAHGITPEDIENVLANAPRFFVNLPERTAEFIIIGPTLRAASTTSRSSRHMKRASGTW
jgi:hypothetical protein